jgi:biopolymer transport protein ExbD
MSHGLSGSSQHVEPNLTPLLDLVLQLLMFFIIVTNFSASQSYEPVDLAVSTTAAMPDDTASSRPTSEGDSDYLFLTIKPFKSADLLPRITDETQKKKAMDDFPSDDLPCVIAGSADPAPIKLVNPAGNPENDLDVWLKRYADDVKMLSPENKGLPPEKQKLHTTVILRTDGKINYEVVYRIMKACKDVGFPKLRVRALVEKVNG